LGPFWPGPFWFAWAVFNLHWGRFGDGPFWSVPGKTATISGIYIAMFKNNNFIIIIIIIIVKEKLLICY